MTFFTELVPVDFQSGCKYVDHMMFNAESSLSIGAKTVLIYDHTRILSRLLKNFVKLPRDSIDSPLRVWDILGSHSGCSEYFENGISLSQTYGSI